VDWYEIFAEIDGQQRKIYVFCMRSMASGAAFHRAYPHATQQAFLEAHELAFHWFGGVFRTLRFDNLTSAVKKILRGHQREETTRFIAFRSHWGFQAEFCTPGEGHEKGGVEGEGGQFRRNHLVPVPRVHNLEELNRLLESGADQEQARLITGRSQTIGALMLAEREHLLPLAAEGFDLAALHFPQVNQSGCVKVLTNFYSTPLPVGTTVEAKVYSAYVEIWHGGHCVAQHERCYERHQQVLELDHYLNVLQKKAWCHGRIDGSGTVSRTGPLASQLRPLLGESQRTGRPSDWHAGDDRSPVVEPHLWRCPRASGGRRGALDGHFQPERDPLSAQRGLQANSNGSSFRGGWRVASL